MSLGTPAAIIIFLVFIIPGIVWVLERSKNKPVTKETSLVELSQVVLSSSISVSVVLLLIIVVSGSVTGDWSFPYIDLVTTDSQQLHRSISSTIYLLGFHILISSCGAYIAARILNQGENKQVSGGSLHHVFETEKKRKGKEYSYLWVRMEDGETWQGLLIGSDNAPDESNKWLALFEPILIKNGFLEPISEELDTNISDRYMLIPHNRIMSIQVQHQGNPTKS